MGFKSFCLNNEKSLSGAAALATIAGVILGLGGMGFAVYQIREARLAVEATSIFELQNGGRALLTDAKPEVISYVFEYDPNITYAPEIQLEAKLFLIKLFQFYTTVFNQRQNGIISDRYWPTFEKEIQRCLKVKPIQKFWTDKVLPSEGYGEKFKHFGNRLIATSPES
jgi:hypothetical protein